MPGWKQRLKKGIELRMLRHSRFFDEKWYREQSGIPASADAAEHYLEGGWREHDPSPAFRQEGYLAANEDVRREGVCPLAHYLFYGRRQQYALYPGYIENHYHRYAALRAVSRTVCEAVFCRLIRKNRETRLLVIAHIYYPEAADEMTEYLKNLRRYRYDLTVTVPEGEQAEAIREKMLRFRPEAEIMICPNRGFDTLPCIETLRRRKTEDYDLILKIHSKANDPRGGQIAEGRSWQGRDRFVMLHRAVLGAHLVHRNIDRLTRDPAVSLITARQMIITDSSYKQKLTKRALKAYGLTLEADYTWAAGGCWMMKASCAEAAKGFALRPEDFGPPKRGSYSPASALERYLTGVIPPEQKYGNPVCPGRQAINRIRFGRQGGGGAGFPEDQASGGAAGERIPTVAFAVTETGENAVAGDFFTATELAETLEKRGWRTKFLSRTEPGNGWYRVGKETDVLISMLEEYDPQHITEENDRLVTIGWARNWFKKWIESPGTALYDLMLASSGTACREMEEQLGQKVRLFPIATNAERFRSGREETEVLPEFRCDYCFTGNRFGKREIETELDPEGIPYKLNIYGTGWEQIRKFAPYCRGHVSYHEMPAVYRGTRIVLDDATPSTKESGSVNSRVYDAIAAGCLVLTNNGRGAAETFEGLLPVYTDRESLTELLKLYLGDETLRQKKVQEMQRFVLANHTYELRAAQLEEMLREYRTEGEEKA